MSLDGKVVLDVGCGSGHLLSSYSKAARAIGIDIDGGVLASAAGRTKHVTFTCAAAESLPFRDCTFDVVLSRVALPYTNIRKSLSEIRRVLRPGGQFWAVLERPSLPFHLGLHRNPRFYFLAPYLLINTLLFRFLTVSVPFVDGRYRGYQTQAGVRRALRKTGLDEVRIVGSLHLIVLAERPL